MPDIDGVQVRIRRSIIHLMIFFVITACSHNSLLRKISMAGVGTYDQIAWSPDGQQIIALYDPSKNGGDYQFILYNLKENKWRPIEDIDNISYSSIAWLDSNTIVFERSEVDHSNLPEINSSLAFYNLVTKEQTELEKGSSILEIEKNPVEDQLALVRNVFYNHAGIYLHNIDTHDEVLLYDPIEKDVSVVDIAWSPDGKTIVYILMKNNPLGTGRVHSYSLNLLNPVNRESQEIVGYSNLAFDGISWPRNDTILMREIDENYGLRAVTFNLQGKKEYVDLSGITPYQIVFSPVDNTALIISLGVPGGNDAYLLFGDSSE